MAKKAEARDRYKELLDKVQGMDLGGGGFWKPKVGRSVIRILPPVGDMEFFFAEVGRHYEQRQYCPTITTDGEEDCPICELNEKLYQAGEKDAAATFRVSRAFWMNIIDRGSEDTGPQIYTPGVRVFQNLVSLIGDADFGDITDEEDGFDIKIDRVGQGIETEYTVMPMRNPSVLGDEDQMEEWFEEAEDLSERVASQLLDWDKLIEKAGLQAYYAEDGDEPDIDAYEDPDEEEEEDEQPIVTRTRRRTRRSRRR